MELITVAAVAENGVIGQAGELPWPSIAADKRQYRARIADWPVILGRRTFDSMRDDLPGTAQIVLSRSPQEYDIDSAHHAGNVAEAIAVADALGAERAYVIGGAEIYALFQPVVDRMVLSRIPGEYDGDSVFPDWNPEAWERTSREPHAEFTLEEWVRRARSEPK